MENKKASDLITMTCGSCGRKLAEIKIKEGIVQIKCNKCGVLNTQETKNTENVKERQY